MENLTGELGKLNVTDVSEKAGTSSESGEKELLNTSAGLQLKELKLYTMSQVSDHCEYKDCWIVLWDKVYNLTHFVKEHPGGEDIILENGGRDATVPFMEVGHSKDALSLMKKYEIGMLIESERLFNRKRYDTS